MGVISPRLLLYGLLIGGFLSAFFGVYVWATGIPIGNSTAPNPYWVIITAIWQTEILGGGAYFFLMVFVPYITKFDTLHDVSEEEKRRMQTALWGFFSKAKHWPDHPIRFMASYVSKGIAFLILLGVQLAIIFSVGWKPPTSWDNLYYDFLFARSTKDPNSAHLVSYLLVPAIGLWVAWKFRTGDGMPNAYLGLIISALGVTIHEGLWLIGYYSFYGRYLTWATTFNVVGDFFFVGMLAIFIYIYVKYPFQKIPLSTFKPVVYGLCIYLILWGIAGFHISTINNFLVGKTQFNVTQWWADPQTNAWEVVSWVYTYSAMFVCISRIKDSTK